MLRLESLTVHRYRNLGGGATLRFSEGVNVLMGVNGAGKTTLLNLIAMIVKSDFSSLADERESVDFEYEAITEKDNAKFRTHLHVTTGPRVEVDLPGRPRGMGRTDPSWTVQGSFEKLESPLQPASFSYDSQGHGSFDPPLFPEASEVARPSLLQPALMEKLVILSFKGIVKGTDFQKGFAKGSEELNQLNRRHLGTDAIVTGYDAGRFDEGLDTFRAYTAAAPGDSLGDSQTPGASQFLIGDDRFGVRSTPFQVFEQFVSNRELHSIHWNRTGPETSKTLATMGSILGLKAVEATPKLQEQTADSREFRGWDFLLTFDPDRTYRHTQLSFGQKRMLAFIWYCGCNPHTPIIADELVNGFHHAWIEAALDLVGERQAFFASQNPLLMDFVTFDSAEQVQKTFVLCEVTHPDGKWSWRNLDETESADFFRAYEVGIQHVSTILRNKGLW